MENYNKMVSCATLVKQMDEGKINFDCAVQRSNVWDIERKSLLIHSILYGYAIPAFNMRDNDEGGFDCMDGKQRSNAIYDFINDEFVLADSFPEIADPDGNSVSFAGLHFDDMPEWAQMRIKDYALMFYYYKDMTDEEEREYFFRLNNGKPLTAVELNRVKAKSIQEFQRIAKHPAIQSILSDKAKARFTDENIAMQIYALINMEHPDFGTKAFRPYIQNAEVTENDVKRVTLALNMVEKLVKYLQNGMESAEGEAQKSFKRVVRKVKSRTHFVSSAYLAYLCNKSVAQDVYNAAVYDFFNATATSASPSYNSACGAGSAKPDAVTSRKIAIENLYRNKLTKVEKSDK